MSTPVSIHDGPFTTNTLASKKFLIFYVIIIWWSVLPLMLEFYLFWKLVENHLFFFILLLPIEIYVGYLILVFSSILLAKISLSIINLIHKPKEGVFKRKKSDKNFYFWSLRAVIKKWPIWVSKFIPLPLVDKLNLRWFHNDSEFIEYGKNVCIGEGSSIKASLIFGEFLIIKKVKIDDNVTIGSNCFIAPGTHIYKNSVIATMSETRYNQRVKSNSYLNTDSDNLIQLLKKILSTNESSTKQTQDNSNTMQNKKQTKKFVKNFAFDITIFGILYFLSNFIPVMGSIYFVLILFFPFFLQSPSYFTIFKNCNSILIFLITPLFIIFFYFLNLLFVIFFTKLFYKWITHLNPVKEGIIEWEKKTTDYKYYFKRSFILRYIKWKIQKSPFPWLIKFAFNFIGNCQIGNNTVLEDSYLAKELFVAGNNTYIGKVLLANHLWDKNLIIKKIKLGNNVTILDNCCIAPGTEINDNVLLLPLSVTTKNSILLANSIYFNTSLTKISKEVLIQAFNINKEDLMLNINYFRKQ
ncbi:MAG: hypothetical protein JSV62_04475 [Promethearchaeota archaeon]|nr:MAG: hypothetical protein JSV62_04475 [Candidatus Lokiarchaeota archaeon]